MPVFKVRNRFKARAQAAQLTKTLQDVAAKKRFDKASNGVTRLSYHVFHVKQWQLVKFCSPCYLTRQIQHKKMACLMFGVL